ERKIVGTAYKQQSREAAIKIGLDFFGVKMKSIIEETESIVSRFSFPVTGSPLKEPKNLMAPNEQQETRNVLVHCWRGGMRSAGVAWLLDLYGFKVYTLVGGYKAYRKWVLAQFEKDYNFNIIGGYTGSGKTLLLHELKKQNQTVIDLEALANHKGSAFGAIGEKAQPKQEMFENSLAQALAEVRNMKSEMNAISDLRLPSSIVYLEDESQRIGNLQIPMPLWTTMRKSPVYFLDIPFAKRLEYITEEYGKFEKENLADAILRIQKRLGGLATKEAMGYLEEGKYRESFRILLNYYDKWYTKGLQNRENLSSLLNKIPCSGVDTQINTEKILSCNPVAAS
ncbi:MAG TPA: tRNA 2-selenouridine(34) synthase MnmH, partial [Ferruginibacter sp.]|nr:tRNA 2-selenouridine(34) synthase MnmH [Ferruginibacter sp.]